MKFEELEEKVKKLVSICEKEGYKIFIFPSGRYSIAKDGNR